MEKVLQDISIEQGVTKLPTKMRVIVAMRSAGYTQQQVGTLLGITRTDVWTVEKSAHRRLRKEIIN